MTADDEAIERLRRIAGALGVSVDTLVRDCVIGTAEATDLLDAFSRIRDPERRKAVVDLARSYAACIDG